MSYVFFNSRNPGFLNFVGSVKVRLPRPKANDIYTIGANLAGLPGMSIPCGFVNNLPVGLQLVGKHFGEESLLQCGHHYQQETDWHLQVPEQFK